MATIERKGDVLIITVPCGKDTLDNGHLSASGKTWVFDAGKLQSGNLTVQVSAYGPVSLGAKPVVAPVQPAAVLLNPDKTVKAA